jgi:pyruvate/2-oxoglutarate dehydrogenase complex dihydrolipoamide dehydrogenase (E3) component
VEVLQGYAKIFDPWTVEIKLNNGSTQRLTTRAIVIAAGARPFVPPLPGLDDVGYVTSDTLWDEFAKLDAPPSGWWCWVAARLAANWRKVLPGSAPK